MDETLTRIAFSDPGLCTTLDAMTPAGIDELDFGVIGFDAAGQVRAYNRHESEAAGLSPARVLGRALFTDVAPCMNNFMVAQRFQDAMRAGVGLDATIDYVLTLRMRPTKVALRLVARPGCPLAYVLVRRLVTS